jgi:hypothetical protein
MMAVAGWSLAMDSSIAAENGEIVLGTAADRQTNDLSDLFQA